MIRLTAFTAAIALAAGVSASLHAQDEKKSAPSVAGTWTMSVDSPHGATAMGLVLSQNGKKVTGTFASPHGDTPVAGEFVDKTLTLATTSTGSEAPQVTFTAKLTEKASLAGYLSSQMGDMTWTAERIKDKQ
jgi:hypothetical protein